MTVKLALVARTDLGMGRGKIAAQAAHAAVAAALASHGSADFGIWFRDGQPRVVLRVSAGEHLLDVVRPARAGGLPVHVVQDAGRTQVTPGTATCCAAGPAASHRIEAVTAALPLL
jgi:PTH2 family peptidyl-tRNA hydrolase